MRRVHGAVLTAILAATSPAAAHVVLSQPTFQAGEKYAAFFKVEHGCEASPTVSLRVQIPEGVTVLETPDKPAWTLSAEHNSGRISAVTWRGRLDAKTADQFGLLVNLPIKAGPLYFLATQQCEKGEINWREIPATGQSARDLAHPAPMLLLVANASNQTHFMAGNIMIDRPWSPATPGGASTAAAYMTIMNHGTAADTLVGGASPIGQVEIHQMSNAGGVMSMRPLPGGISIPAGGTIDLGPQGNYHLMLTGLKTSLREGTRIPVTLRFAKAGAVDVELAVARIGARSPDQAGAEAAHHH